MNLSRQADKNQLKAIMTDGHSLVSACPGAGKTRVLALRSARLLTGSNDGRLVAVTFTRDAAKSLRQRILKKAGNIYKKRVASGTFHSLALHQLQKQNQSIRIISPREQYMLLTQAWRLASKNNAPRFKKFSEACEAVEAIKSSMKVPPSTQSAGGAIFHIYQRLLTQSGAADFADILRLSVEKIASGKLKPIQSRWMLVDEAQDMDEVQYAWIKAHVDAGVEVMCVADDDQSIYQWRHALGYQGLMRFKKETQASHILLPTNYRCRPEILSPATKLIKKNKHRVSKSIQASRSNGGGIYPIREDNREKEVERLASHLLNVGHKGWCVLSRTNWALDTAELALASHGIPFERTGGKSFWEKPAPAAYINLLKSIIDNDSLALIQAARWAGVFRNEHIEIKAGESPSQMIHRLLTNASTNHIAHEEIKTAKRLGRIHEEWMGAIERGNSALVFWGVAQWLSTHCHKKQASLEAIFDQCAKAFCATQGTIKQRLFKLTQPPDKATDENAVALMTIHASKGLEFPHVWIMACEEGNTPHKDGELEEERRLFYVAMTRAEENLVISYAESEGKPSRFYHEAGLSPN